MPESPDRSSRDRFTLDLPGGCEILVVVADFDGGNVSAAAFTKVAPSAARLTESLRDIGYDFPTAVADIVDNSVAAGATRVEIEICFDGSASWVSIADDGRGMSHQGLEEALRFGSRRDYDRGDLGRYGLGLKTASLSQCRAVTVVSRLRGAAKTAARTIDLDIIAEEDDWLIAHPPNSDEHISRARGLVIEGGTVVIWQKLDRVLPERNPDGGWARRRVEALAGKTAEHLSMVFHRYLEGHSGEALTVTVNGNKIDPWNPFAPSEPHRYEFAPQRFEINVGEATGVVTLHGYVLPSRDRFSSLGEFERQSGPLNWNRQQGLYIYRADRLVQWGGWGGVRGIDEHTKLARAALEFDTDLDLAFHIDVAKMRVSIPPQLRQMLEKPINELCARADDSYRKTSRRGDDGPQPPSYLQPELPVPRQRESSPPMLGTIGLALRAAAMHAGEYAAWQRIADALRDQAPDVARMIDVGP